MNNAKMEGRWLGPRRRGRVCSLSTNGVADYLYTHRVSSSACPSKLRSEIAVRVSPCGAAFNIFSRATPSNRHGVFRMCVIRADDLPPEVIPGKTAQSTCALVVVPETDAAHGVVASSVLDFRSEGNIANGTLATSC
jgi:hypothetical protein